jgi:hypothetical protein
VLKWPRYYSFLPKENIVDKSLAMMKGSNNNTLELLKTQHVAKKRISFPHPHERFVITSVANNRRNVAIWQPLDGKSVIFISITCF